MKSISLIAAIGTPLTAHESLHLEGLQRHLHDQWEAGITGVLVGGTMGLMQLLPDKTYLSLVEQSIRLSAGRGQVLIGVGDTALTRTLDRVNLLNRWQVDGVVVLCPYLWKFTQQELIRYFSAIAECSKNPVFLYDLPVLTGTKLELETVLALAKHKNIRGIKSSGDFSWTRQLIDLAPAGFEVIVAQADLMDVLLRHGVRSHLDGIYAAAPMWVRQIAVAADAHNWDRAAEYQQRLSSLLRVVKRYGVFQAFTAILNARGVPGNFAPAPLQPLPDEQREALVAEPIVQELLSAAARPGRIASTASVAVAGGNGDASGNGQGHHEPSTAAARAAAPPRVR
jgi:4-hydroxy-tetrahydrodipicolinate synthase